MTLREYCKSISLPDNNQYYHGHYQEYGKRFVTTVVTNYGEEVDCSIPLKGDDGITDIPLSKIFEGYADRISHVIVTATKDLAPEVHHECFDGLQEEVKIKLYMDGR